MLETWLIKNVKQCDSCAILMVQTYIYWFRVTPGLHKAGLHGIHWCHSLPLWLFTAPVCSFVFKGNVLLVEREATETRHSPHSADRSSETHKIPSLAHPQQHGDCHLLLFSFPLLSWGDRHSRHLGCTISEDNTKGITEVLVCTVAITSATLPSGPWQVCSGLCFGQLWPMEALPGWWNAHLYLQSGQSLRENAFFLRRKKSV